MRVEQDKQKMAAAVSFLVLKMLQLASWGSGQVDVPELTTFQRTAAKDWDK